MKLKIQNKEYDVEIIRKNNKNTYIRVKEDGKIYVTTSYLATNKYIEKLLLKNIDSIEKMLQKQIIKQEKKDNFYYLGKSYSIIYMPTDLEIIENRIYVKDDKILNKWIKKEMTSLFQNRLKYWYNIFEERIPYPNLRIRTMKTRWGVCNRKNNTITLNSELIKYEVNELDYVIVHELSHFVHFNHSKNFWNLVSKYYPNYKQSRKKLKE